MNSKRSPSYRYVRDSINQRNMTHIGYAEMVQSNNVDRIGIFTSSFPLSWSDIGGTTHFIREQSDIVGTVL